ncbi:MAG TPA: DNA repair protein RecO [Limnochordia bacterium]
MALYKSQALVLRTRPLGEGDKVVTLFAEGVGKVAAVARGARRVRSRLLGGTQPFVHGRFLLFRGKSLDTLSQVEIVNPFRRLREDLTAMAAASYTAELVDLSVEEREPIDELFGLLLGTWHWIASGTQTPLALRAFELRAMSVLGYRPVLAACAVCGGPLEGGAGFAPAAGGAVCRTCAREAGAGPISPVALAAMQRLAEAPFASLSRLHLPPAALAELTRWLRLYVDYRLERAPRSLAFLEAVIPSGQESESGGRDLRNG